MSEQDNTNQQILDNLSTGAILLDTDLSVIRMNPAAEMLLAVSARQASGHRLDELAMGADRLVAGLQRSMTSGNPYSERELSITPPGSHPITIDCVVTPLMEMARAPQLLLEIRQVDRQLRIHREEQLIAQHQTARLLVRNLAHEVKNPLGGLRGAAQLLERELIDGSLKEYTQIIIHEADRLTSLVDSMLGPLQPSARNPVNIHEVLERVRKLVSAECSSEIYISRDYDPSIPTLIGDTDQLVQAVLNIVRNAVQAMENSGEIMLSTRIQRHHTIGQNPHRLVVRIDIIDDGPGISEDRLEEIFYPMISGTANGTGLGLAIAQRLVSEHGGLIECQSRPGETVFSLLIPLEQIDD